MRRIASALATAGASLMASMLVGWPAYLAADPPKDWQFLPFDQAWTLAQQDQRNLFVYFGRQGCPSCDKTNRESLSDPKVKAAYQANYVLTYVDSESGNRLRLPSGERITEMELGVRLKVFGTPFFYFLQPDGEPVARVPGYQSAEDFLLLDAYVKDGHFKQQTFADFKASQS
jgi:thioredoxin-related protein